MDLFGVSPQFVDQQVAQNLASCLAGGYRVLRSCQVVDHAGQNAPVSHNDIDMATEVRVSKVTFELR